ncbi:MAG: bacteriophage holin [Candidatus Aminicenantes bacterium]|nr:bacteriophage holin [Candidatus Aminicenantes bacterium]
MKLNVKAFAFTCALFAGVGLFLITWWIILFSGATQEITFVGKVYRGYSISPLGSVIGLAWGLVDGFIAGALFAWLYNVFAGRGDRK